MTGDLLRFNGRAACFLNTGHGHSPEAMEPEAFEIETVALRDFAKEVLVYISVVVRVAGHGMTEHVIIGLGVHVPGVIAELVNEISKGQGTLGLGKLLTLYFTLPILHQQQR